MSHKQKTKGGDNGYLPKKLEQIIHATTEKLWSMPLRFLKFNDILFYLKLINLQIDKLMYIIIAKYIDIK